MIISPIYNITYDNIKPDGYRQVTKQQAYEASTRKNFKCFQFEHIPATIGVHTIIEMVPIKDLK